MTEPKEPIETIISEDEISDIEQSSKEVRRKSNLALRESKLVAHPVQLNTLPFDKPSAMLDFFTNVVKSKNVFKDVSPELAVSLAFKCRALGIDWSIGLDHMFIVKGKASVDVHLRKAILLRPKSGVEWEYTHKCSPVFQLIAPNNKPILEDDLPSDSVIIPETQATKDPEFLTKCLKEGKFPVVRCMGDSNKPIDYKSVVLFRRKKRNIDGEWTTYSESSKFTYLDARAADLLKKDNWISYWRIMLPHRAWTIGSLAVAADLTLGLADTYTIADVEGVPYTPNEQGEIIDFDG